MRPAGPVIVAGAQAVADAGAPVLAPAQDVLAGVQGLAVAAVQERSLAVGLGTVRIPRHRQQVHVEEGKARPEKRGVWAVDHGNVLDNARIDLAQHRVDIQAGLHLVHPVGGRVELAGMVAADPRVEVDGRGPPRAHAGGFPGEFAGGGRGIDGIDVGEVDLAGRGVDIRRLRSSADADLRKLVDVEVQQVVDFGGIGGRRTGTSGRGGGRRVVVGQKANGNLPGSLRLACGGVQAPAPRPATRRP